MNEDNFIEEWLDHYPNRKMAYSEAANYLRSKQPEQQPVEEPDQWIPQSNLRQRSQPGYEDIPAMPDPRNMPDTLSDEEKPGMVAQFIKTIYPQAQLDDNIIAGIVGDFARPFTDNPAGPAIAGGVRDLGQGLVDVASEVSDALGLGPIDVELPQIESADDPAAHLVRGMTQFFAGFGAAGGLAKGATLMRQTLAGGAADATFDPELGNLSTLLREQFNVDNALVNYLDAKVGEDADAAERLNARVKMVLEGAGLGALAPAAMFLMRHIKNGGPKVIQKVKDVIAGRPGNFDEELLNKLNVKNRANNVSRSIKVTAYEKQYFDQYLNEAGMKEILEEVPSFKYSDGKVTVADNDLAAFGKWLDEAENLERSDGRRPPPRWSNDKFIKQLSLSEDAE